MVVTEAGAWAVAGGVTAPVSDVVSVLWRPVRYPDQLSPALFRTVTCRDVSSVDTAGSGCGAKRVGMIRIGWVALRLGASLGGVERGRERAQRRAESVGQ
ncbi:hypothetical protein GCM10019016_126200 [Streptomyces prasinosporus]|uniref:Uncharacterized protein n=1 Tax=Streptomyces prasinosporus TaxID=68256 RepID=A0ABP6UCK9_9ACTN|nr:hypothetical protein GCM10010332_00840 [Streptomyces albogriseolus]